MEGRLCKNLCLPWLRRCVLIRRYLDLLYPGSPKSFFLLTHPYTQLYYIAVLWYTAKAQSVQLFLVSIALEKAHNGEAASKHISGAVAQCFPLAQQYNLPPTGGVLAPKTHASLLRDKQSRPRCHHLHCMGMPISRLSSPTPSVKALNNCSSSGCARR